MVTNNMLRHAGSSSSSDGVSLGDTTDQNSQHINEAALSTSLLSMDTNTTTSNKQQSCKILKWSFYLVLGGTILGLTLPKNTNITSQSWQLLSNIIGYTYFLAWSLSFYPQIYLNYQRKTTQGLSVDFCCLNVLGYVCYTIYTTNFFFNKNVIDAYKDKMSISGDNDDTAQSKGEITVTGNDVAFAIHAIIMASVTLLQVGFYDSFTARPPSKRVYIILFCTAVFCLLYIVGTWSYQGQVDILGFLYVLGTIKICVTIGKYVPQALMNQSRKSTVGWNVWNVILDLTGGILSLIQLVGDCWAMDDWSGIVGNPAKMLLSLVTITFDGIFLVQHYILYPENEENASSTYSPLPAIE